MNFVAFLLVMIGGALGVAILVQSGIKSLVGWAIVAIAAGVIVQHVFIHWAHTIHV